MRTQYEPTMTMAEARDRYFEVNGFGAEGGYNDAWVDFKLGPIPMPFPNTPARIRAVRFHDLHHVLTDYDTDTLGEFEISAWEIAAGCRGFIAAWIINLAGMAAGLFSAPRRIFRAFVRGRRMHTLYDRELDGVLHKSVAEMRAEFERPTARPVGIGDVTVFAATSLLAIAVAVPMLALALVAVPIGLLNHARRRRHAAA